VTALHGHRGECLERLGRPAEAIAAYEACLERLTDPARAREVRDRIAALKARPDR